MNFAPSRQPSPKSECFVTVTEPPSQEELFQQLSTELWQTLDGQEARGGGATQILSDFLSPLCALIALKCIAYQGPSRPDPSNAPRCVDYLPPSLQADTWEHPYDSSARLTTGIALLAEQQVDRWDDYRGLIGKLLSRTVAKSTRRFSNLGRLVASLPVSNAVQRLDSLDVLDSWIQQFTLDSGARHGSLGQYYTPKKMARLMIELAEIKPGQTVYDPCFGMAEVLSAVSRIFNKSPSAGAVGIFGVEKNADVFVVGLARTLLTGEDNPGLRVSDAIQSTATCLPDWPQEFDCVLAVPPYGAQILLNPSSNLPIRAKNSDTLFLQHAMLSLKHGGRAVVAFPRRGLVRGGPDQEVRKALLKNFAVEGVIDLPDDTMPMTSAHPVNLIVFSRTRPRSHIRFIQGGSNKSFSEAPGAPSDPGIIRAALNDPEPTTLKAHGEDFFSPSRSELFDPRGNWCRDIPISQVHDANYHLANIGLEYWNLQHELQRLQDIAPKISMAHLQDICDIIRPVSVNREQISSIKGGRFSTPIVRSGDIKERRDVYVIKLHYLEDDALSGIKKNRKNKIIIRSNDVLISTFANTDTVVLGSTPGLVGAVAGTGIRILRTGPRISPGYLRALLSSPAYREFLASAQLGTSKQMPMKLFRKLKIPLPSLEVQRSLEVQMPIGSDVLLELSNSNEQLTHASLEELRDVSSDINSLPESIRAWLNSPETAAILSRKDSPDPLHLLQRFVRHFYILSEGFKGHSQSLSPTTSAWVARTAHLAEILSGIGSAPQGDSLLAVLAIASQHALQLRTVSQSVEPLSKLSIYVYDLIQEAMRGALSPPSIQIELGETQILLEGQNELLATVYNDSETAVLELTLTSSPDAGTAHYRHVPAREVVPWHLSIDPKDVVKAHETGVDFILMLTWRCRQLDGHEASGVRRITLPIVARDEKSLLPTLEHSPYVVGTPVYNKAMFFGRGDILRKIRRQLGASTHANVILLEGNRRTGKTSILMQLKSSDLLPDWIPVYFSLQEPGGTDSEKGIPTALLFRSFALAVAWQLSEHGLEVWFPGVQRSLPPKRYELAIRDQLLNVFSENEPFEAFTIFVDEVLEAIKPRKLLLMLDEFDVLGEGIEAGITSPRTPQNLRYLLQHRERLCAILTGALRLGRLREDYWSALFGIGPLIRVGVLEESDAKELVTQPVAGLLAYGDQARNRLVTLCAAHPFLVQSLCNKVFDDAAETGRRTISIQAVESAARKLIERNEHFSTLWNAYTGSHRRRAILAICQRASSGPDSVGLSFIEDSLEAAGISIRDPSGLVDDIEHLRNLEILELTEQRDSYRIRVPLFSLWIQESIDYNEVIARAREDAL